MDKHELLKKAMEEVEFRYIEAAKQTGLLSKEELETLTRKQLFSLASKRMPAPYGEKEIK